MTSPTFVLTGAPGTGKSAVLACLRGDFDLVAEPAREIIAEQRATGGTGTAEQDPSLFVELLLQRSIEKFTTASHAGHTTLFDRGIPDCVAYAIVLGVDPAASIDACRTYRHHDEVLLFEPWEAIYTTDDERRMSFADTLAFHRALADAYEDAGYAFVTVPRSGIDERAAFVRRFVRTGTDAGDESGRAERSDRSTDAEEDRR